MPGVDLAELKAAAEACPDFDDENCCACGREAIACECSGRYIYLAATERHVILSLVVELEQLRKLEAALINLPARCVLDYCGDREAFIAEATELARTSEEESPW